VSALLDRRVKAIRARALQRQWAYRQRHTSQGVWTRVGRVLAMAEELWEIPPTEVPRLIEQGFAPEPVGEALEPPKTIFGLPRARLEQIAGRRRLPLALGPAFRAARALVTIAFGEDGDHPTRY